MNPLHRDSFPEGADSLLADFPGRVSPVVRLMGVVADMLGWSEQEIRMDPAIVMFGCQAEMLAKGHPLGATGLVQTSTLVWQLRDQAEARQVDGACTALQHYGGLGSAEFVYIFEPKGPASA